MILENVMEFIDLSYYKILPQQTGITPKILVSEITNEIEFIACTDTYNTTIDFVVSKIMEHSGINCEPVYWGSDLRFYEQNYVTLTKFDLSNQWVYFGDNEILDNLKNKPEIDFSFMISAILGGNMWAEDLMGFVDENDNLKKSFHYNMMFEVELAMYCSGHAKAASIFEKTIVELDEIFDSEDEEIYENMRPYVEKFLSIKKSDWFNILKFPQNSKYEKCKFWAIKKILDVQKILRKKYE
jgi:hypothetical protein